MTHIRHQSSSVIARVIEQVAPNDVDLLLNPCTFDGLNCRLSSGSELLFVALTGHYIVERSNRGGIDRQFHDIIFIPSQRAETRGGFDLSIGDYRGDVRVRSMHKALDGRRTFNRWCDEPWQWCISRQNSREQSHVRALLQAFADRGFHPFIFLHVCYCVHEYRRMGYEFNGITIPSLASPLRSVIVDLGTPLLDGNLSLNLIGMPFEITVRRDNPPSEPGEELGTFLARISDVVTFRASLISDQQTINLPILSLDDWYTRFVRPTIP